MKDMLNKILQEVRKKGELGLPASYIPALAKKDNTHLAVALMDKSGKMDFAGEAREQFTLQSMSKILTYTMALMEYGEDEVFSRVGVESVDLPFNTLNSFTIKPNNPMINAGAMVISSMVYHHGFDFFLKFVREMTNNPSIQLDEEVFHSEKTSSYRNPSIAYYLKDLGNIDVEPTFLLDYYYGQCSVSLDVRDLATIASVYANDGVHPITKKRLIDIRSAEIVKTIMAVCGMYDETGNFLMRVGIPSKSGVSGGILAVVPGRYGIGVYGPGLDANGNSIAGAHILEILSKEMKLNIFSC